jgi:hypothetical protein
VVLSDSLGNNADTFCLQKTEEGKVAKKTIYVSDLTGDPIDEKDGATVTISYNDARRGVVKLDVNASEVEDIARRGTKQARRGRRPKAAAE